jgi:hypothetical protein
MRLWISPLRRPGQKISPLLRCEKNVYSANMSVDGYYQNDINIPDAYHKTHIAGSVVTGLGIAGCATCVALTVATAVAALPIALGALIAVGVFGLIATFIGFIIVGVTRYRAKVHEITRELNDLIGIQKDKANTEVEFSEIAPSNDGGLEELTVKLSKQHPKSGNATTLMLGMKYCDDKTRMSICEFLKCLPPENLARILKVCDKKGRNLPLIALRHGGPEVKKAMVALLGKLDSEGYAEMLAPSHGGNEVHMKMMEVLSALSPSNLVEVLEQVNNESSTIAILAMHHGSNTVRTKMLEILEKLPLENRMKILEHYDNNGDNVIAFALSNGDGEIRKKALAMLNELLSNELKEKSPTDDFVKLLKQPNRSGSNLAMYALGYGDGEVRMKMLGLLERLPKVDLIEILQQHTDKGGTIAMYALGYGNDEVRMKMLEILETLKTSHPNELAAILKQCYEGSNLATYALGYGDNEVRMKTLEILEALGKSRQNDLIEILEQCPVEGRGVTGIAMHDGDNKVRKKMLEILLGLPPECRLKTLNQYDDKYGNAMMLSLHFNDGEMRTQVWGILDGLLDDALSKKPLSNDFIKLLKQPGYKGWNLAMLILKHDDGKIQEKVLKTLEELGESSQDDLLAILKQRVGGWNAAMFAQYRGNPAVKERAKKLYKSVHLPV